ncbi:MAG: hypothetical protein KZQ73_07170 [Candidatus Thiodiazotropha sp. (ex Semelilucina semeliformis)]|nr:hypothetical protein [Candidatus Thiodiazotropha sp. (ex Semelilucina semeliformis)]
MSERVLDLIHQNLCLDESHLDELGQPKLLVIAHTEYDNHDVEYWLVFREAVDVEHTELGQWYFMDGVLIEPNENLSEDKIIQRFDCKIEELWIGED